ncbi:MAG: DUF3300 domain-containing protein [Pseudomonadota bacterium]|nr:DUF3300 domain-containing protein [Pseudomonadota bacterium]
MRSLQGICFFTALLLSEAALATPVDVKLDQNNAPAPMDTADELVAPLVHYPDDIVDVIFQASRLPEQIALAARYLSEPTSVKSEPSFSEDILALMQYPTLLIELSENLVWLSSLHKALGQSEERVWAALERQRQGPRPELGTITVAKSANRVVYRAGPNSYVKRSSLSPRTQTTAVYHSQPHRGAYSNRSGYRHHYDYWPLTRPLSHWHLHRHARHSWRGGLDWRTQRHFGSRRHHQLGWSHTDDFLYRHQRKLHRQIARDHRQDRRAERHQERRQDQRGHDNRSNPNERPIPRREKPRPYMQHDGPLR